MVAALDLGCSEVDRLDLETGCVTACIAACTDKSFLTNMPQQEVYSNIEIRGARTRYVYQFLNLMCAWANQQIVAGTMVTANVVKHQAVR